MKLSISGSRRRSRLVGAAAVVATAALALSGCSLSSSSASSDDADTLTVGIWKDYGADLPWVAKQFKAETGATLKFQYIDSEENLLQLMDKANGGIDVALPNVQYIGKGIEQGLFHELDTSKLTNYDDIYSRFRDLDEIRRDGKLYGIPWTWGSTGVFYDTKDYPTAPTSISTLWDAAAAGKVAVTDDATVLVPSAALYLGEDPQNPDMTKVKKALEELKANTKVTYSSTSDLAKSISSGSVSIGIANSDGIGGMIGGGQGDLAYTVPKEGAVGWIDNWAISAKTKHLSLAYKWLDYMTGSTFLTKWANTPADAAPAPANEKVVDSLSADTKTRLQADPSSIDRLAIQLPVPAARLQEWTDTWQEVKAG
ncbi:ABC transporter substrate-binding protein [Curtobacterium sp. USHLN213]|uniref:ABC transporter substrate-binding protein n=1 Tax=Curtobacterium sp. USHLN213 TaxID=3081255 RepID=UPI00301A2686